MARAACYSKVFLFFLIYKGFRVGFIVFFQKKNAITVVVVVFHLDILATSSSHMPSRQQLVARASEAPKKRYSLIFFGEKAFDLRA